VRSFTAASRCQAGYSSIDEEHAALIDPSSLRKSLDAIRAANRARLIRKVDHHRNTVAVLSLPQILHDDPSAGDPQQERTGDEKTRDAPNNVGRFRYTDSLNKSNQRTLSRTRRAHVKGRPKAESGESFANRSAKEDFDNDPVRVQSQQGDAREPAQASPELQDKASGDKIAPSNKKRRAKTHTGQVAMIIPGWQPRTSFPIQRKYPWMMHMDGEARTKVVTAAERLDAEIAAFRSLFTPTAAENQLTQQLLHALQKSLDDQGFDFTAELIGSRANGLASPLSDLDINLIPKGQPRPDVRADRAFSLKKLTRLQRALRKWTDTQGQPFIKPAQLVARARVPILKAFHPQSGLEIQFQMSNEGFNTTSYAKSFVREFPSLRAVFLILRQFLIIRGLNHGFAGGLTSYPLLNMVVAAMLSQESEGRFSGELGEDFLYVLDFWTELDLSTSGIAVSPFEIVPLDKHRWNGRMYLRDPADPSHDIGVSATRILDVQASLQHARRTLAKKMAAWDEHAASGVDHMETNERWSPLLGAVLLADYQQFLMERSLLTRQSGSNPQIYGNKLDPVVSQPSTNE
jgi:hypothetical protein